MRVINGLDDLRRLKKRSAVTIGVFDGVHAGHRQIIKHVVKNAKEKNLYSVVVTFDPHPAEVLKLGFHPTVLTGKNLKLHLIKRLGVSIVLVIKFSKTFARKSAPKFIEELLVEKLRAAYVAIGEGFKFGAKAHGDINLLRKAGAKYGFEVEEVPLVSTDDGLKISSTRIRNLLKEGRLDEAKRILGHRPIISGKVVVGKGYGDLTGFHTANIVTHEKASVPKEGVYTAFVLFNSKKMPAVVNIGPSPTFHVKNKRIEVHILKYDKELYGKELEVELVSRLRDIKRFKSPAALSAQIKKDIAKAKTLLSKS